VTEQVRDAATVVLLRDTPDGLQTFVLRRVASMAFAPRMHVFPGGRVDEADFRETVHLVDSDVHAMALRASCTVDELVALYSCAVRETQEEAGVWLAARDEAGHLVIDPRSVPLFDHWVTPEGESRRYDVRFFIARVDSGDDGDDGVRLTTTEADSAAWIAPSDAVDAFERGEMAMLPPTERVLRWLAGFVTADEAIGVGAERIVVPKMPLRTVDADGLAHWVLVNHRSGEVLVDRIDMPHTRETDGQPMDGS
jgi:8-oxo-dGTP pyrophosphatase MutT (NUDIX family)